MSAKDDEYMHEINRLEGDRDYWKRRSVQFERALELVRKQMPEEKLSALAELCRNVGGPCFCGCHISTVMNG